MGEIESAEEGVIKLYEKPLPGTPLPGGVWEGDDVPGTTLPDDVWHDKVIE